MSNSILYRSRQRWQIWVALAGSILIHVGAVAASHTRTVVPLVAPGDVAISVTLDQPESQPEDPPPIDPPVDPLLPQPAESDIPEEITPTPLYRFDRTKKRKMKRPSINPPGPRQMSAVRVAAINAPKPEYPYEARRQHATGSGVAILKVDWATGYVSSVEMQPGTGNALLDSSTVSAFRRWRFKPGTVSTVRTPITFTLMGVQY